MVSREAVIWGYRLILGREPESEAAIEAHTRLPDIEHLRNGLLNSTEFARKYMMARMPRHWVAAPVMGGRRLIWVDLGDRFVSRGCLFDSYEPTETRFVQSMLRSGDMFVDVGANIGWYTLLASTIVGDAGRVYAFEPRPETGDYLERTVALNGLQDRVTVYRFALSDSEGEAVLAWGRNTDNPGGSFLTQEECAEGMERQRVPTQPLDDLMLDRVDFMKVDVEGSEMRVFKGARQMLERCRPVILSELSPELLLRGSAVRPEAFFSFFRALDYRFFIIDSRRCGEEVMEYPADWHRPLLNLAILPQERTQEEVLAALDQDMGARHETV